MNVRFVLLFSVSSLFAVLPLTGNSQQASSPANLFRSGTANPQTHIRTLEDDPRLKVLVSIERTSITLEKALSRLTALTKIKLQVRGVETSTALAVFRYKDVSLRDILYSLASARNLEWKYNSEGIWVASSTYDASQLDIHRPRNLAQAELARLGEKLMDEFNQLPQNMKDGLMDAAHAKLDPANSSSLANMFGVSISDLPASMQQTLQEMVTANEQDAAVEGRKPPSATDFSDARVTFGTPSHQEGFDAHSVHIASGYFQKSLDKGTTFGFQNHVDMNFNVFQDPRDRNNRVVPLEQSLNGSASSFAAKDAASRKDAIEHDKRFENRVSIHWEGARFRNMLITLAAKADISVTAPDRGDPGQPRRTWNLEQIPLKDALDKIAEVYEFTWGVSKSGVIVFHPNVKRDVVAIKGQLSNKTANSVTNRVP